MRVLRAILRNVTFWLPIVVVLIFGWAVLYFMVGGRIAVREQQFRVRQQRQGLVIPSATDVAGTAAWAAPPRARAPASPAKA